MIRLLLVGCLYLGWINIAAAQEGTDTFTRGVAAYEAGRYVEAIRAFGELVEAGYASVPLYYNLANAYYQNDQPGPAVLYYEQALRLAPGDADVRTNLSRVRDEVMDGALDVPPFFLTAWVRGVRDRLAAWVWTLLALLAATAAAYGLYAWRTGARRPVRKRGLSLFVGGLLLLLPMLWFAASRAAVETSSGIYIVLQNNLPLREAPSAESRRLETLPEGYRLEREDRLDPWIKVVAPSGSQGWVDGREGVGEVR